jgi:cytochrome c553
VNGIEQTARTHPASFRKGTGKCLLLLLLLLALNPGGVVAQAVTNLATNGAGTGPLVWETPSVEHTAKPGEVAVHFVFKVKNTSASEVVVDDIKSSCDCTLASLPTKPWRLTPNETNKLDVVVDLRDKSGSISPKGEYLKEVLMRTTTGTTNLLKINLIIPGKFTNEPPPVVLTRLFGQQLSAVDHQAVFKNDCVKCHLVPAFGKSDERLFHVTCGICHEAKDRAAMVPDLHSLKTEIDTNYWRNWVTDGKAGTLMPGFAAKNGGPLDDAQINSLLTYLTNAFPRPIKTPPPAPAKANAK